MFIQIIEVLEKLIGNYLFKHDYIVPLHLLVILGKNRKVVYGLLRPRPLPIVNCKVLQKSLCSNGFLGVPKNALVEAGFARLRLQRNFVHSLGHRSIEITVKLYSCLSEES